MNDTTYKTNLPVYKGIVKTYIHGIYFWYFITEMIHGKTQNVNE